MSNRLVRAGTARNRKKKKVKKLQGRRKTLIGISEK
jgi:hypothetical protein